MTADSNGTKEREEVVFIVAITVKATSHEDAWAVVTQLKEHERVVAILPVRLKAVSP